MFIVDKSMKDDRRISSFNKVDLLRTRTLPSILVSKIPRRIGSNPCHEEVQEFWIFVARSKVLGSGVLKKDLAVDIDEVKVRTDGFGGEEGECCGGGVDSSVVEGYWVMLVTIVVVCSMSGVNGVALLVMGEEEGAGDETQGWMMSTASGSCCSCFESSGRNGPGVEHWDVVGLRWSDCRLSLFFASASALFCLLLFVFVVKADKGKPWKGRIEQTDTKRKEEGDDTDGWLVAETMVGCELNKRCVRCVVSKERGKGRLVIVVAVAVVVDDDCGSGEGDSGQWKKERRKKNE